MFLVPPCQKGVCAFLARWLPQVGSSLQMDRRTAHGNPTSGFFAWHSTLVGASSTAAYPSPQLRCRHGRRPRVVHPQEALVCARPCKRPVPCRWFQCSGSFVPNAANHISVCPGPRIAHTWCCKGTNCQGSYPSPQAQKLARQTASSFSHGMERRNRSAHHRCVSGQRATQGPFPSPAGIPSCFGTAERVVVEANICPWEALRVKTTTPDPSPVP